MVLNENLQEAMQPGPVQGLSIITSGPIPPNPSELLSSNKMAAFLAQVREKFDIVLIDSPPVLAVTDPAILATMVDGVALVIRAGFTRLEAINSSVEQLKRASEKFLGIVLNQVKVTPGDYNYYYYYGGSNERG